MAMILPAISNVGTEKTSHNPGILIQVKQGTKVEIAKEILEEVFKDKSLKYVKYYKAFHIFLFKPTSSEKPKAALNYCFLVEQFNFVKRCTLNQKAVFDIEVQENDIVHECKVETSKKKKKRFIN